MGTFMRKYLLFAALATVFACDDSDTIPEASYLEVNTVELSFDEQHTQTVSVETNGRWNVKITKGGANFSVTPAQGKGPGEVTITMTRSTYKAINGKLQINYLDERKEEQAISREIRMEAGELDVTSTKTVAFDRRTTEIPVDINWPGAWTAELDDTENYSIDNTSGEGYGRINVMVNSINHAKNTELTIALAEYPRVKIKVKISCDGSWGYKTLNEATVGKGIDVVLVGDGFLAADMEEGGRWEQACDMFMENFFAVEPLKTYRDHFNVYAVAEACEQDFWDMTETITTKFGTYHPLPTWPGYENNLAVRETIYRYAYENTPVKEDKGSLREILVALLLNTNQNNLGGTCQGNHIDQRASCGIAMASFPMFMELDQPGTYSHELIGHGFGAFHENYVNSDKQDLSFPFNDDFPIDWFQDHQRRGVELDTEFSDNPDEFINTAWRDLYKMKYRNVEIVEGARTYGYGVWRSSKWNAMCSAPSRDMFRIYKYFSPVQRELLLRYIYKYSGMEAEYSLQTFLDYDVVNEVLDEEMAEWMKEH